MRPLVGAECDKLMTQEILMAVQHADWAATIVPNHEGRPVLLVQ